MTDPIPLEMNATDQLGFEVELLAFYQHVTLHVVGHQAMEFRPTAVHVSGLHRAEDHYLVTMEHNDTRLASPVVFRWRTIAIPDHLLVYLQRAHPKLEPVAIDWNALLQQAPAFSGDVIRYHDWGATPGSVWLGQYQKVDLWAIPQDHLNGEIAIVAQHGRAIDNYSTYPMKHGSPARSSSSWQHAGWQRYHLYQEQHP